MGSLQQEPRITSITLVHKGKKKGVEVTHEMELTGSAGETYTVKSPRQFHRVEPHPDLKAALDKLSPHLSNVVEMTEHDGDTVKKAKTVRAAADEYPITSVYFRGGKGYIGVQLEGYRTLSTSDPLPLKTRVVRFNDPSESYGLAAELQAATEAVQAEARALLGGKHEQPAQQSLKLEGAEA